MNHIYQIHADGREIAFVFAPTPGKAKVLARQYPNKACDYDWIHLRARQHPIQQYDAWDIGDDLKTPRHLFDVETYEDEMDALRQWINGQL